MARLLEASYSLNETIQTLNVMETIIAGPPFVPALENQQLLTEVILIKSVIRRIFGHAVCIDITSNIPVRV